MDSKNGGPSSNGQSRKTAAEIARAKVLAAYNSDAKKERKAIKGLGRTAKNLYLGTYKDTPIDAKAVKSAPTSEDLKKYHSAWQNYYQKYYSDYYSKAAKSYLENEKLKTERRAHDNAVLESPELAVDPTDEEEQSIISTLKNHVKKRALAQNKTSHRLRRFIPLFAGALVVLLVLFLQYNRLVFAPIMAYVSPGNSSDTGISAIDPTITTAVGADNRLIIPKLNVDVPVNFGIANDTNTINMAMENGVAQFSIPGASAMPGEIGNLVITGHSAGDIYSNNQYKFIFSGLERLGNNDLIYIDYQGTRYTYSVIKKETVEPSNVGALVYDTDKPMLTLITCTPLGTSRYRLLVTAEQINPAPSGATQSDTTSDEADAPTFESMPENEPTFFERIWRFLTGQN
ncbi:sortase [Candidatus Saccharibacteria bacterium]|nr:sortase [Candidatus Saccharibacteria bacterium]